MIIGTLTDVLISKLVERGVSAALETRGSSALRIETDPGDAGRALKDHLHFVERWCSEISFRDLLRSKKLGESFVDLECHLGQVAATGELTSEPPRMVSSLLNTDQHVVVLGRPGAGKTTSIQRLAFTALQRYAEHEQTVPLVLRLRDLIEDDSVLGRLAAMLGVRVSPTPPPPVPSKLRASDEHQRQIFRQTQRRAISAYLGGIRALLFIDGLDECRPDLRNQVEREIDDLMQHASKYRIVVTCRTADYNFVFPAQIYTLLPLTREQVRKFSVKWLGAAKAEAFMTQLSDSPYRGAEVIPITIAHLCAIFERRGSIPPQPRFVYHKIVRLLLEEWDEQRGIRRVSRYAGFDIDRKLEFLRRIAYELTVADSRGNFTHAQLEQAYLSSYTTFDLPREECSRVAREIESHSGLILQSSYDRYEFAHKSIQEYLTAEYLVRLPAIPANSILNLGDELAIATSLSSRAELYVESIAEAVLASPVSLARARFAGVFLSRIAIERPNLSSEEWVGWILLVLCNISSWNTTEDVGEGSRAGFHLLRLLVVSEGTREPIFNAIRGAYRVPTPATLQLRVLPPTGVQLPKLVRSNIFTRVNPGITIDDEILDLLALQD